MSRSPAVRVTSSTGKTVYQAVKNFITHTSRHLYFSHNQVIIIGQSAGAKGVYPLLDFFIRSPQPRPYTWILIAQGKASDVLRSYNGQEKIDALGLAMAVRSSGKNAYAPAVTLQEFSERLMSTTTAPVAPLVEIYEETGFAGEKTKRARILGTAVFRGDRFAGKLGLKETRGLLWVLGKVKEGIITVPCPGGRVSLEIKESRSRIERVLHNGRLSVKVEVKVESNLGDQSSAENPASPARIADLEKKQAEAIRGEILAVVRRAKQLHADIFGFGEEFHRRYPGVWPVLESRWQDLFPDITVEVVVKSRICNVGGIGEPLCRRK